MSHSTSKTAELLRGSIDTHVHAEILPDRRSIIDLAKQASAAGVRAIVLKSHYGSSSDVACLANEIVAGTRMIGSIALNRWIGGLNTFAVKDLTGPGSNVKVIHMPTRHAINQINWAKRTGASKVVSPEVAVPIFREQELITEAREILEIIADRDLVLSTAHLSPEESILLIKEARNVGVKKILVTHPLQVPVHASIEQQRAMAKEGAYMEHCFAVFMPDYVARFRHQTSPREMAEAITQVGPEHCVIATDCGQKANPGAIEALEMFIRVLLECGITSENIERMVKLNPLQLLGL